MHYRFRRLLDRVMWRLGYRRKGFVYGSISRELVVSAENFLPIREWANVTGRLAMIVGVQGDGEKVTLKLVPVGSAEYAWVVVETEATK